jgi:hypothetical protein
VQVTPDFPVLLASCPVVQFEASTINTTYVIFSSFNIEQIT